MKALVKFKEGINGVAVREIKKPVPKPDEILIKIMAAGLCGTDVHIINDEFPYEAPVILGHEFTGTVEKLGKEVRGFKVDDQVIAVTSAVTCESCDYCRQGLRMLCEKRKSIGSGVNGSMAEYMVIPAKLAYKVPKSLQGSVSIAIAEPFACAVRAVIEQSNIKAGDIVLISGPGTMGLLVLQIAKIAGAFVAVIGTEADERRLEKAKELGADIVCNNLKSLEKAVYKISPTGVDVAYECAGVEASFKVCMELVKKRGNLAQVGLFGKPINVDLDKILYKEVHLTVSFASEPTSWDILVGILDQQKLNLDLMISEVYPIEEWKAALENLNNKKGSKLLLKP